MIVNKGNLLSLIKRVNVEFFCFAGKLEKNLPLGLRREEASKVWNMGS